MNRRGAALPLVIVGVLTVSTLAATAYALARLRWLEGEAALRSAEARVAAMAEVQRIVARWDRSVADTVALGQAIALPGGVLGRGITTHDSLVHLGEGLYLVYSTGERRDADGSVLARATVSQLVRQVEPTIPDSQAVLSPGPVVVEGLSLIDGEDRPPPSWTGVCPAAEGAGIGVRHGPGAAPRLSCTGGPCVLGAPPTAADSTLTPAAALGLGPVSLAELLGGAEVTVEDLISSPRPVETAGRCDRSDSLNWGDPQTVGGACAGYFPVLAARPGTRVTGGTGQGILIGEGDLELAGDFSFYGVVVGNRSVVLRDRARVYGTILARDSALLLGEATVARSSCAIRRVRSAAGRPFGRVERGWWQWP